MTSSLAPQERKSVSARTRVTKGSTPILDKDADGQPFDGSKRNTRCALRRDNYRP